MAPEAARLPLPAGARLRIFGFAMFDFANSSFTTVIISTVFAQYFVRTVAGGGVRGDASWGIALAISQLIVLVSAPILGAVSDFAGARRKFLMASWLLCCAATASLASVGPGDLLAGAILVIVANVAFSSGENLVAAWLPEIAPKDRIGRVSGLGWGLGFIGGLLALLVCLPLVKAGRIRETNLVTAAFFLLAGIPTFLFLRGHGAAPGLPAGGTWIGAGIERVRHTLRHAAEHRTLLRFLAAFAVYNTGITAVISFAAIYAENEIGMTQERVLVLFVLLQVSAAAGALAFGHIQDRIGARRTILITLVLWILVDIGAFLARSPGFFTAVGVIAGLAIGSSQSASRAMVGILSPRTREAEFFGFWGLFGKLSAVAGPLAFGLGAAIAGRRAAVLVVGAFFVAGALLLRRIPDPDRSRVPPRDGIPA